MPLINFKLAKKVALGTRQAKKVYLGSRLVWEGTRKVLFYDSSTGEPFDIDSLELSNSVIVIPKKGFPLDSLIKEEDPYGTNPDEVKYSYNIATMDTVYPFGNMKSNITISVRDEDQSFKPTGNTVWYLFNQKKSYEKSGLKVTDVKFIADWIDKIYLVDELKPGEVEDTTNATPVYLDVVERKGNTVALDLVKVSPVRFGDIFRSQKTYDENGNVLEVVDAFGEMDISGIFIKMQKGSPLDDKYTGEDGKIAINETFKPNPVRIKLELTSPIPESITKLAIQLEDGTWLGQKD